MASIWRPICGEGIVGRQAGDLVFHILFSNPAVVVVAPVERRRRGIFRRRLKYFLFPSSPCTSTWVKSLKKDADPAAGRWTLSCSSRWNTGRGGGSVGRPRTREVIRMAQLAISASPLQCRWISPGTETRMEQWTYAICLRCRDHPRVVSEDECCRCACWESPTGSAPPRGARPRWP